MATSNSIKVNIAVDETGRLQISTNVGDRMHLVGVMERVKMTILDPNFKFERNSELGDKNGTL